MTRVWSRRMRRRHRTAALASSRATEEARPARLFALLVGIDDYPSPIASLRGCVNDIEDVHRYLTEAVHPHAEVRKLTNREATCSAVISGFRRHLGLAGPGDTALFWYSGYGSTLAVPPGWWKEEPDGTTMQTFVCADSRGVARPHDLLDRHLHLLTREVASGGAHVVVVLDCGHAGHATGPLPPSAAIRQLEPAGEPPSPAHLTLTMQSRRRDHVALSACGTDELAHELPDEHGDHRGVFSRGLLAELRRAGADLTYRDLVSSTRGYVQNLVEAQTPNLYPAGASIVEEQVLGGQWCLPPKP